MSATCVKCSTPLGVEAKEIPFNVAPVAGGDPESWCPQCFVWHRAPQEPERFPSREIAVRGGFVAVRCTHPPCGVASVDPGTGRCLQCNCGYVRELGPRPAVETMKLDITFGDAKPAKK